MPATIEIAGHRVPVSHQDKVLFPADGITKGDVVGYYRAVADVLLPHVTDRPLNLRRFPDGIEHQGFFQQHAGEHVPDWVRTVDVPARGDQDPVRHVRAEDEATLAYLANLGAIELHRWLSGAGALSAPDLLVVDLDPPESAPPSDLRDAAGLLRDVFTELSLVPFVQTTGGRGYHVVAPLDAHEDEEFVRPLVRRIADHTASLAPDRLTTEQRKAKRGDRIFLDTNRNGYGQTAVAPYSVRARPGAPVATPIEWDELGRVAPDRYSVHNVTRRLAQKPDPWRDIHRHAGSARTAADRLAANVEA